jgi:hypothetical protein
MLLNYVFLAGRLPKVPGCDVGGESMFVIVVCVFVLR